MAKDTILTIVWNSVCGWDNRPDCFRENTLLLMADLAYFAQVEEGLLTAAFGDWTPMDMFEVDVALQNGDPKAEGLRAFLKHADETGLPMMCDLSKFEKVVR